MPEHSIHLNEFKAKSRFGASAAAILKLCTARRPDGQAIIDFGSLSKKTVAFVSSNESRDDEGHSALKISSLVCQAFLPICRKRVLFGSIVLNDYSSVLNEYSLSVKYLTSHAFVRLLLEKPEIADYVRRLEYIGGIQIGDLAIKLI